MILTKLLTDVSCNVNPPQNKKQQFVVIALLLIASTCGQLTAGVGRLRVTVEKKVFPGVKYVEYRTKGRRSVAVHAVYYDRTVLGSALRVMKSGSNNTDRLSLVNLATSYEEQTKNNVLALVNANFWRAGRSTPIGPCVVDGEVVEMTPYKHWTSAFIDANGRVVIDTFRLTCSLTVNGQSIAIDGTNRRTADSVVVLYNSYSGGSVPFVSPALVEHLYAQMMLDSAFLLGDSTEKTIDTLAIRKEIERVKTESDVEHGLKKIRLRYTTIPAINKAVQCIVLGIDTGKVMVPTKGCIVSVPKSFAKSLPNIGDTVTLQFSTNVMSERQFMNAVCGTPRLVRNGRAKHEAKQEGVTGRRFIQQKLARTCIGIDKAGETIILASIEPTNKAERTYGTTLAETAQVMKMLGAYQAMNLDGGGSAGMVVKGDHVFFEGIDPETRAVSVGIGVVEITNVLRHYPK